MTFVDDIYKHLLISLLPFIGALIAFIFWIIRWMVNKILDSNDKHGQNIENLYNKQDAKLDKLQKNQEDMQNDQKVMDAKVDAMANALSQKVDYKAYSEGLDRAFNRIDDIEKSQHEIEKKFVKIESTVIQDSERIWSKDDVQK